MSSRLTINGLVTLDAVAPVRSVRAAAPGTLAAGEGTVVTVASLCAFSARGTDPHMSRRTLRTGARAAALGFTCTLADESTDSPIRVDVVSPGSVATGGTDGADRSVRWAMSPGDLATGRPGRLRLGKELSAVPLPTTAGHRFRSTPGLPSPRACPDLRAAC
ncbi:SDR family oxidoreductase [Streptomyces sp. NPDC055966]|uniref:SDR family oxidoreductase n=1 Tax=Streptomyces sp. NPDC055966 TaxID=3345669 RepID=UPI0035E15E10